MLLFYYDYFLKSVVNRKGLLCPMKKMLAFLQNTNAAREFTRSVKDISDHAVVV
jgi:hypothetical protein